MRTRRENLRGILDPRQMIARVLEGQEDTTLKGSMEESAKEMIEADIPDTWDAEDLIRRVVRHTGMEIPEEAETEKETSKTIRDEAGTRWRAKEAPRVPEVWDTFMKVIADNGMVMTKERILSTCEDWKEILFDTDNVTS